MLVGFSILNVHIRGGPKIESLNDSIFRIWKRQPFSVFIFFGNSCILWTQSVIPRFSVVRLISVAQSETKTLSVRPDFRNHSGKTKTQPWRCPKLDDNMNYMVPRRIITWSYFFVKQGIFLRSRWTGTFPLFLSIARCLVLLQDKTFQPDP